MTVLKTLKVLLFVSSSIFAYKNSYAESFDWEALDQEYFQLITEHYQNQVKLLSNTKKVEKIEILERKLKTSIKSNQYSDSGISFALKHFPLISDNLDTKEAQNIIRLLLKSDLYIPTLSLVEENIDFSNVFTAAKLHYLLASFYFKNNDINNSLKHLSKIETSEALSRNEQDYAIVMAGVALQEKRKHREAIKTYEKIKPDSYYFGYAQLNKAVGLIRQGWWTDAQLAIEDALKNPFPEELKDLSNRLLLIMAYSQIQNEFYRNARKTLRRITLDSQYLDRALLGLGLCALNQKDYVSAINAFTRLQNNGSDSLSAQETYLLIPLSYERMQDLDTSSSLYSQAIEQYNTQKKLLETQLLETKTFVNRVSAKDLPELPNQMANRIRKLNKLTALKDEKANPKLTRLLGKYEQAANNLIRSKVESKIEYIDSYLNQAQYGLAKLYDNN